MTSHVRRASSERAPAPAQLWGTKQATAADRYSMEQLGVPSPVLMERASLCVAAEVQALAGQDAIEVLVLVGPGNNGGDGLALARILAHRGVAVRALLTTPRHNDAVEQQLALARAFGVSVDEHLPAQAPARAVVVDAMLGTGSSGPPRGGIAAALRWQSPICGPRVAIDVPTGVEVDTGTAYEGAFVADVTVTFVRSKVGLHVTPGRDHAGRVVVADIGIAMAPGTSSGFELIAPGSVRDALCGLPEGAHKGERGHVGIVGGARGTPGAAILAGLAALRSGAGLVTVITRNPEVREQIIAHRPELMVTDWVEQAEPHPAAKVLVVGPGLTDPEGLDALASLYRDDPRPALWDASALAQVPADVAPAGGRILTPHPGEAARMLAAVEQQSWSTARVQRDRIDAARRLAGRFGAWVVLKGEATLVAEPDGVVAVSAVGGPALATAGSGDALSGLGGAMLARGLPVDVAARVAVHVHGLAGDRALARHAFPTALDVIDGLGEALRDAVVQSKVRKWPLLLRG